MTDQDYHTHLQYQLVEPVNAGLSYASGLWTVAEIGEALTRCQRRLLVETGLVVSRAPLNTIPNTPRHRLPADYAAMRRVTWHAPTGRYSPLLPMTWLETDFAQPSQPYLTHVRPWGYLLPEDLTSPLTLQVVPAAFDGGLVEVWYVAEGPALSNTGVPSLLPDELGDTLLWGTLATLLLKAGRGFDAERAAACHVRYEEGVALAQASWLGGMR